MCFHLVTAEGTVELPPKTLVVAVDDTGNEAFPPKSRCFGLGGCAFLAEEYAQLIDDPWRQLKASYFQGPDVLLHAAALRQVSAEQAEAIGKFFQSNLFFRLAATAADSVELSTEVKLINAIGAMLMDRVLDMVNVSRATGVVVIAEHSQRLNRSVHAALGGRLVSIAGTASPVRVYFLPKQAGASCLEVADFVVHTAGAQLRKRVEGRIEPTRRDFKSVFWRVPRHLSYHNELISATRIDA